LVVHGTVFSLEFFDSNLADAVGYELAIETRAVVLSLHTDLASDAIRKAPEQTYVRGGRV
jgi:hypothetical protein